ncbi:MAG TPA: ribosome small subunit-dependent GTPase A [Candidatus Limnocylindrales bacterium]
MDDPMISLGWDEAWAATFRGLGLDGIHPARVVQAHRDSWLVAGVEPAEEPRRATVAGRLRHETLGPADLPAVGDWVATTVSTDALVIQAVLARRSAVGRAPRDETGRGGIRSADEQVLAANVDDVLVVSGLDRDFNLRRIERYLAVAWSSGATPLLVLNKADLDADVEGHRVAAQAVAPGVEVIAISAHTGAGLDDLRMRLRPGRTAVILGSSGVGKSTLLNALLGTGRQLTGAVREDDQRGRHTTTARELVVLPSGALLIDTPGLRSLDVAGAADGMDAAFADVAELARSCRFQDCRHAGEPGCAVTASIAAGNLAAERLASYRKLEKELAFEARKRSPRAMAEERRRWRLIHQSAQRHARDRYGADWQ